MTSLVHLGCKTYLVPLIERRLVQEAYCSLIVGGKILCDGAANKVVFCAMHIDLTWIKQALASIRKRHSDSYTTTSSFPANADECFPY